MAATIRGSSVGRHSISVSELTRNAEQQPRAQALMGNMEEAPAARKLIRLLYISLGKNGQKNANG